jgi:large subunit GTPase 1
MFSSFFCSDVVVQIVDARNPLLFRCEDLEHYVKEVGVDKKNVILLNKADFLSRKQRDMWADYFSKQGVRAVFFSATKDVSEEGGDDEAFSEPEDEDDGGDVAVEEAVSIPRLMA